jgi:hypothetical protein
MFHERFFAAMQRQTARRNCVGGWAVDNGEHPLIFRKDTFKIEPYARFLD